MIQNLIIFRVIPLVCQQHHGVPMLEGCYDFYKCFFGMRMFLKEKRDSLANIFIIAPILYFFSLWVMVGIVKSLRGSNSCQEARLNTYLSIYRSLSVYSYTYLSIYLSVYLSCIHSSIRLTFNLSFYLSIYLSSIHPSIFYQIIHFSLSIYLSIYIFIYEQQPPAATPED